MLKIALWVSTYIVWPVAILPGPIHSFTVLYTEKIAFQCVTQQS